MYGAQFYIVPIEHQLTFWEAHGGGTITAAPALVEYKLTVALP